MKKIIVLVIAVSVFTFSCHQTSSKEVQDANENLSQATTDLKDANANEVEAAKVKAAAEWKNFKNEADSSIAKMESDLEKKEVKIKKASKKDKQKLEAEYAKAKTDMVKLKEDLQKRNVEFENDLNSFDNNISVKYQSFEREFKHDMDGLGKSLNDLFKDNVN